MKQNKEEFRKNMLKGDILMHFAYIVLIGVMINIPSFKVKLSLMLLLGISFGCEIRLNNYKLKKLLNKIK